MPVAKKPSETQKKALRRMIEADGTVYRVQGGFWISGSPKMDTQFGGFKVELDQKCDDVWCDVRTIRAMEKQGWIERTNTFPEEWRDTRTITQKGREVL